MSRHLLQDFRLKSDKPDNQIRPKPESRSEPIFKPESKQEKKPEAKLEVKKNWESEKLEPKPKPKPVIPENKFASIYEKIGESTSQNGRSHYRLWVVAALAVGFLLFALSFLFTKAKIIITPKVSDFSLNENLSATKDSSEESVLPFDLVVLEGVESKTAAAGEEKDVAVRAKGRAIIYNAYSSSSQPLLIDTRLEGSNGKIYKTETKLVVPGKKSDGTPGSVEVGIYAENPGADYNSEPLDFKIFGFKGTPKYNGFYARSKGEIAGGFIGKTSVVSPEQEEQLKKELATSLKSKLYKKALDQLPGGFVLFEDAAFLDLSSGNIEVKTEGDTMTVSAKGTLSGFLFEESSLTKKIAERVVPKYDGSDVYIQDIQSLKFSLTSQSTAIYSESNNILFNLSGPIKIISRVDENKVLTDILGKAKKDFNQILSGYPSVASAELVLRPFWKRSFPEEREDIEIVVNYPK